MKNKKIFIIIILLAIPGFVFAQRPLEVTYPTTPGGTAPTTVGGTSFAQYVRYIYNISFGIAAVIAFLALVYAGFLYLSSAGNPIKISEAKSRIISTLLGIGVLLISYVLLIFINPETVMFISPQLSPIPSSLIPSTINQLRGEKLGTVKEIGIIGGLAIQEIESAGSDIFNSSLVCNCIFAKGLCLCDGGDASSTCNPEMCYAGEDGDGHPCSNYDDVIDWQETILFRLDELVYYQNRAVGTDLLRGTTLQSATQGILSNILNNAMSGNFSNIISGSIYSAIANSLGGEARSLQDDINNIANPTIAYYKNYISSLPPGTDPRTIQALNNRLSIENNKSQLKQDLVLELVKFSFFVELIKDPIMELATLTEQCALATQTQCTPKCIPSVPPLEGSQCHDTINGCQAFCLGLNPCPIIDIAIAWVEFSALEGAITNSTQEIARLVDEIRLLE